MDSLTREDLQSLIASEPRLVLLEALPQRYYDSGHLPSALPFPLDRMTELAPKVAPYKDAPIVVYCASSTCRNSHSAATALRTLGYSNVRVYAEGKADWEAAGLPLVR